MKTLKLDVSLEGITLSEPNKTPAETMSTICENIIFAYGNQKKGLDEKERRFYYKIQDAFDAAIKDGKDSVELEDEWMGFLRKCIKESLLIPSTLLRRVEDKIAEVANR